MRHVDPSKIRRARKVSTRPAVVPETEHNFPPVHRAFVSEGVYGVQVVGGCMVPLIEDGEVIACDASAPYTAGDLVVIYYRTATGEIGAQVKRLTLGLHGVAFPFKQHPQSECVPLASFECLVPPRNFMARVDKLLNIHKVVGKRGSDGKLDPALVEANAAHWQAQIEARRTHLRVPVIGSAL